MSKKMTYQEAMTELENIISGIEEENISIDVLSSKVKRATELIKICKTKLYKTDEEIQKVLKELEDL
ncbi:exodeoxyribonuclease VII small subunit [bacterium SCSIO 12643]|nr:exodeoxyribonuclease VII small subunit [bacterium SCSIO 12643]